jgi:hypothetical protein
MNNIAVASTKSGRKARTVTLPENGVYRAARGTGIYDTRRYLSEKNRWRGSAAGGAPGQGVVAWRNGGGSVRPGGIDRGHAGNHERRGNESAKIKMTHHYFKQFYRIAMVNQPDFNLTRQ